MDIYKSSKTARQWGVWECAFFIKDDFENPFMDVDISAEFSCDGQRYYVNGFYDGTDEESRNHIFRLRFSPVMQGIWKFVTHSNYGLLEGIKGEFSCTEPDSKGGLCIDMEYPNYFAREDGSRQLIINDGWFPHAANGHAIQYEEVDFKQPSEEEMKRFIDILSSYGVNMIIDMSQLYARQKSITDTSFAWPWKVTDPENNKIDKDRFNLDFYRRFERILSYCSEKEVFFAVELLFDNSTVRPLEWSNHPLNVKNGGWLEGNEAGLGWGPVFDINNKTHMEYTRRYMKYTIARLAPYRSVLWEIGGENANLSELPEWMLAHCRVPGEHVAQWYNYWGSWIKQNDPYMRLCTYGDTTYYKFMVTGPGNDWVLTQDPRNYPKDDLREYYKAMSNDGALYWQFGRPMVIGEMNSLNNGNYSRERRMYWTALASGFHMGRSDRHFPAIRDGELTESVKFADDFKMDDTESFGKVPPVYRWLKLMKQFTEDRVSFWRMHPANELVENDSEMPVFCLAEPCREYLLYMPFGGRGRIKNTQNALYECCYFNPRNGEMKLVQEKAAGELFFKAPDNKDWAVHIRICREEK